MQVAEADAGFLRPLESRVGGLDDSIVDFRLRGAVMPTDGECPGDVSRVERVQFNTRIDKYEVACLHSPRVVHPVQRVGMVARGRDCFVAQPIPVLASDGCEGAFDHAFPAGVADRPWQGADNALEAGLGCSHCLLHLPDLVAVFGEAQFAKCFGQCVVSLARILSSGKTRLLPNLIHKRLNLAVSVRDNADLDGTSIFCEGVLQRIDMFTADTCRCLHFRERWPGAYPEFSVA